MVETAVDGRPMVRYRSPVLDSARWEGFPFRGDDIVISTPPKCGTTWTQMICALLIHGTTDLPQPLNSMSPWLDALYRDRDDVVAALRAQPHRRFIKSHTPLDGLPYDERVTYICVGRDPRDVGLSTQHHMANMDPAAVARARARAVGEKADAKAAEEMAEMAARRVREGAEPGSSGFLHWVENRAPVAEAPASLRYTLHHLGTFWEARHLDNVVLLHYDDLKSDLAGNMLRLAQQLGITVAEEKLPDLVRAATFEAMRGRADQLVPEADMDVWRSPRDFFHRGSSGQWQEVLTEQDLRRYAEVTARCAAPGLAAWLHPTHPLPAAPENGTELNGTERARRPYGADS
ncbi:sulfotransferase domain-containing protein [Streptomyces sp. B15]|uniref:sulfotransferase domain-containing protein n=1 Tax=Streptomyces sp. B15 TaxID=1537797 RepID=UPI001B3667DB|nr:sulfotransferase domain-containing protein [Streptomyces sp. B15]MBQ1119968.1 sulfotransferase domain-containing protein [Streptomyces sp. B15]